MISKKLAVSATRHGLDERKSKMPRKMSKSVCLYLDVERQLLLHPQWRHSSMGFFFVFCFAIGSNSGSKDPNGRKELPAATRSEHGCSTWAFAHTPAGLCGRDHFLAPLSLVPDERWFCASQHQGLSSDTCDRNWCCWCSSMGCSAASQYPGRWI